MSIIKKFALKPLERPKYVNDSYDWQEGLSDEEEKQLHNALNCGMQEKWHQKSYIFLKKINYGMFQPKEKIKYLIYFYQHQLGEVLILDEATDVTIKDKKIIRWIVIAEEQLKKLNLGNERDFKEALINVVLPIYFQA